MLTQRKKASLMSKFQVSKTDSGSSPVQIALLTERIKQLTQHLKTHKKDKHSRRGLIGLVAKRRKHLSYLAHKNPNRYKKILEELGLKR